MTAGNSITMNNGISKANELGNNESSNSCSSGPSKYNIKSLTQDLTVEITESNNCADRSAPDSAIDKMPGTTRSFDRPRDLRRFHSCSYIETSSKHGDRSVPGTEQHCDLSSKTPHPNYCIETDLEPSGSSPSISGIIDSHMSYRKALDEEITHLKVQLAKSQSHADHLEHERNKSKADCDRAYNDLSVAREEHSSNSEKMKHLETVVSQLQDHAREGALERAALHTDSLEAVDKCVELQFTSKRYRNELRKIKKELALVKQEVDGKAMEIQGLKSENDWLKKQLWPEKSNVVESEDENDHQVSVAITGIRQFLSPRKPRRRRRQSEALSFVNDAKEESFAIISKEEDIEDRTADYTSQADFARSATDSGLDFRDKPGSSKQKIGQNSFITKLAIRHGALIAGEGSQSEPHRRSQKDDNLFLNFSEKDRRDARKSRYGNSSNQKSHAEASRDAERLHIVDSLSKVHIEKEVNSKREDTKTDSNGNQWNIWGMFTGNGSKSKIPVEDQTKDLSDSSHLSDDYLHTNHAASLSSQASIRKVEQQAKPGTVLVPKRWTNNM